MAHTCIRESWRVGGRRRDRSKHGPLKLLIPEPFGRDQENVDVSPDNLLGDGCPLGRIAGIDRGGSDPHSFCRTDLIAHQGEQGGHEKRRPAPRLAEEFCGDEVDEALPPSGFLNNQEPSMAFDDMADRLLLPVPKRGTGLR